MTTAQFPASGHFDQLYAASDDPWKTRERWYEQRKRAIIEAILPRRQCNAIFEPGCGSGELTLQLATRCQWLMASDFCAEAVRIARQKTAHLPHVQVRRQSLPEQWPTAAQDMPPLGLIVFSELCYYFDAPNVAELAALAAASLAPQGHLLACHWKKDFDDRLLATQPMHQLIDTHPRLKRQACYEDEDILIDLWRRI
ncbi:SAM-dependent methyltransferase [Herbaspirillum sp. C7C8]|uniref:SAM-dependent methyltransferase n=1 Tax=Herbaspirillum sp. C7C8 TaxID=2736665 RepID=UPI001F51C8E3|nr:SAM-dependent methyltransferase [Herbaspirillum sp. C7C8]MCI1003683.1 methyltransferase domain-containing protein [Herbaspirillum sp. C7C8]